jgi:tetratricopeptide (TPR) repeat protein
MKKPLLLLLVFIFTITPSFAQQATPTPAEQATPDFPQKPTKPPETAEELYEAARWEQFHARNTEAAIKLLDRALILKPDFADGYWQRGLYKSRIAECEAAIADFDVVIQLAPDSLNAYQERGECKIVLEDLNGAMADFNASVNGFAAKNQVQYNASLKRGKLKYVLKDYNGALADFSAARRADDTPETYLYSAFIFMKRGDTDGAINDLRVLSDYYFKVTEDIRKKFPDQYAERKGYPSNENPLETLKKRNKAEDDTANIVVDNFGEGIGNGSLASDCKSCPVREFAGFEDKIIPDNWFFSQRKIFLPPMSSYDFDADVIFYFLGDLLEQKGDKKGAIEAFTNSIIGKGFQATPVYFRRGKLLLQTREFEPAVRDFSWAIYQDRAFAPAYLERGVAILMLGHEALAQKDFDAYLKLNTRPEAKQEIDRRIAEEKNRKEESEAPQENTGQSNLFFEIVMIVIRSTFNV